MALSSRLVMRCLSESGVCVSVYTNMKGSFEVVQYTYVLEAEYTEIGHRMAPHTQPHQTPVRPQVFSHCDLCALISFRCFTSFPRMMLYGSMLSAVYSTWRCPSRSTDRPTVVPALIHTHSADMQEGPAGGPNRERASCQLRPPLDMAVRK